MMVQTHSGKRPGAVDLLTEKCTSAAVWLPVSLPEGWSPFDFVSRGAFCGFDMQKEHGPIGHRIAPGGTIRIQHSGDARVSLIALDQNIEGPQIPVELSWLL